MASEAVRASKTSDEEEVRISTLVLACGKLSFVGQIYLWIILLQEPF